MSDSDSFINEVTEEVRKDRFYSLWRRYGPLVIGAVVLIIVVAAGKTWWDAEARKEAREVGGALVAAASGPPAQAADALLSLADQTDHAGASLLARLRAAASFATAGDRDAAVAAYDAIAVESGVDPAFQDFAAYRAVMLRAPDMDPAALVAALEPIAGGAGPFRLLALEAQALALLRSGDTNAAHDALRDLAAETGAPQGLRQRVLAIMGALGVEPHGAAGDDDGGDAEG